MALAPKALQPFTVGRRSPRTFAAGVLDERYGGVLELKLRIGTSGVLLVHGKASHEERLHVVEETTHFGATSQLNRGPNVLATKVAAHVFGNINLDALPDQTPSFVKVGGRTGHLEVVHVDHEEQGETGVPKATVPGLVDLDEANTKKMRNAMQLPIAASIDMAIEREE